MMRSARSGLVMCSLAKEMALQVFCCNLRYPLSPSKPVLAMMRPLKKGRRAWQTSGSCLSAGTWRSRQLVHSSFSCAQASSTKPICRELSSLRRWLQVSRGLRSEMSLSLPTGVSLTPIWNGCRCFRASCTSYSRNLHLLATDPPQVSVLRLVCDLRNWSIRQPFPAASSIPSKPALLAQMTLCSNSFFVVSMSARVISLGIGYSSPRRYSLFQARMATADGAHGSRPPLMEGEVARPAWISCRNSSPYFLCTYSTTFFHPSACFSLYISPAPGQCTPLCDHDEHSVMHSPEPALCAQYLATRSLGIPSLGSHLILLMAAITTLFLRQSSPILSLSPHAIGATFSVWCFFSLTQPQVPIRQSTKQILNWNKIIADTSACGQSSPQ